MRTKESGSIPSSHRFRAICVRVRARERERERACARPDTTFLKWKKTFVRERDRLRESNQETEKIRLLFSLAERGERRTMISGARESERERGVRDGVVCVVVSSKRTLKGKETFALPREGFFSP